MDAWALVFLNATAGLGTSKVCVAYQTGMCLYRRVRRVRLASPLASVGKTGTLVGTYLPSVD